MSHMMQRGKYCDMRQNISYVNFLIKLFIFLELYVFFTSVESSRYYELKNIHAISHRKVNTLRCNSHLILIFIHICNFKYLVKSVLFFADLTLIQRSYVIFRMSNIFSNKYFSFRNNHVERLNDSIGVYRVLINSSLNYVWLFLIKNRVEKF